MNNTNLEGVNDTASIKSSVSDEPANISDVDFISYRTKQSQTPLGEVKEKPPEEELDESDDVTEEAQEEEETGIEEASENETAEQGEAEEEDEVVNNVLSQLDLENLTDEQFEKITQALLDKGLSTRAVDRFGKLTARAKSAEEQLAEVQRQLEDLKSNKENPLQKEEPVADNPYNNIESISELQERYTQFGEVETWARDVLEEHEESGFDDVITEVEGQELTKRQVKQHLSQAIKARDKFLPARYKDLQKQEAYAKQQEQLINMASEQLPWLKDEHNDTKKYYDAVVNDERVAKLKEIAPPEIKAQLDFILAHYANSIQSLYQKAPVKKKATPAQRPPSNPGFNTTRGHEGADKKLSKKIKEMEDKFNQSQSTQDLISLRTLKIANKLK